MVVWPKPGNTRSHPAALNLAFLELHARGKDFESHQSRTEEKPGSRGGCLDQSARESTEQVSSAWLSSVSFSLKKLTCEPKQREGCYRVCDRHVVLPFGSSPCPLLWPSFSLLLEAPCCHFLCSDLQAQKTGDPTIDSCGPPRSQTHSKSQHRTRMRHHQ